MRLLLDTHAFIWALAEPSKLSLLARQALLNPANECFVSAVSLWEISMKHSSGKLDLEGESPEALMGIAQMKMGFTFLSLDPEVAATLGHVPRLHGDPFDRMLIHQAISGGFYLVSADRKFKEYKSYGLKLVW